MGIFADLRGNYFTGAKAICHFQGIGEWLVHFLAILEKWCFQVDTRRRASLVYGQIGKNREHGDTEARIPVRDQTGTEFGIQGVRQLWVQILGSIPSRFERTSEAVLKGGVGLKGRGRPN